MLDRTLGSVVTVAVYKTDKLANRQLGFRGDQNSQVAYERALDLAGARGSGSGFVISYQGKPYVITNSHVIENASDEEESIAVYSIDRSRYEVRILGGDSFYDIAVLEFIDRPGPEMNTIKFREGEARLGEKVYAIGNPLGEYPYSVSDGIISAKNRVRGGLTGKFGFLQTTATVIWGNSGGPLVDANGEVVGINSQIAFTQSPSGSNVWLSQINFALEGELSNRLVREIIENDGRVERAYFGMELSQQQQYNPQTRRVVEGPVHISAVLPDAPSGREMRPFIGMELVQINNTPIHSIEDALYELERTRPGESLVMLFSNDGQLERLEAHSVALESRELEAIAASFVNGITDVELGSVDKQVTIRLKQNRMQQYQGNGFGEMSNPQNYLDKSYVVLAAGIKGENYERMWRVDELYDLGAALKLSGLSGVVDLYVAENTGGSAEIQLLRRNFTEDQNTRLKKMWY